MISVGIQCKGDSIKFYGVSGDTRDREGYRQWRALAAILSKAKLQ